MVVGFDALDAMKPAGKQTLQEAPPVDFGLTGGDRATQHPALAGGVDADGDQHGAIDNTAFQSDFLVPGSKGLGLKPLA